MPWLAFDYGLKHIGVAVAEPAVGTASPLTTLRARNGTPRWPEVDRLLEEWRPDGLIVGLPLNMDDTESPMAERARGFGRQLASRYGLATEFADERLSTFEARARSGAAPDHAVAAQIIAETWLACRPR